MKKFFTHYLHLVREAPFKYGAPVLVVVLILGYVFFGRGGSAGATFVVSSGDFREQVSVSGTVIAANDVDLGFAANGRIAGTYARVGQYVGAGTLLAQVENGDLLAALAEKRAALASLQAGTRPEQLAIKQAAVASDKAKLVDAITAAYTTCDDAVHNKLDTFFTNPRTDPKLTFTTSNSSLKTTVEADRFAMEPVLKSWALLVARLSDESASDDAVQSQKYLSQVMTLLADSNSAINQGVPDPTVTASVLSSYGTTLATARTNVNDTAAALTSAMSALTDAEKSLDLDLAGSTSLDLAAAQAEVENARAALAKTYVVAPFAGIVTRMDAKVGEIVSPSESLISMQSAGVFEIETFVPEVAIARIAPGNPATTTLDAYGSAVAFPAKVVAVDPAETVKDGVPTYKTTLAFLAADPRIRSGMTANVVMETGMLHDAIVIPAGAVGSKSGESYVSILEKGTPVNRTVSTGPSPALGQAHILSGLFEGDVILLSPAP